MQQDMNVTGLLENSCNITRIITIKYATLLLLLKLVNDNSIPRTAF